MKTFREYIQEVIDIGKLPGSKNNNLMSKIVGQSDRMKNVSSMKNHEGETHHVYRTDLSNLHRFMRVKDGAVYHFANDKGETQLEVHGTEIHHNNVPVALMIDGLYGKKGSTVRATDAYKHLMSKHGLSIISDKAQSKDGAKVWKRLVNSPEVKSGVMKKLADYKTKPKKDTPIVKHGKHKWALLNTSKKSIYHSGEPSRIYAYMDKKK